jgi:type IV secretion system protein TrbL
MHRRRRAGLAAVISGLWSLLPPSVVAADPDPCIGIPDLQVRGVCSLANGAPSVPGAVAQFGADQAERALTKWVVDTATWVLDQLVNVIFTSSSPVLSADWFRTHYADMVAVAWVIAPLFLILGVIQAIIRADISVLGRMAAQLFLVALLTTGAVAVAQMLIGSVDQLSAFVSRNSQHDLQDFLTVFLAGTMTTAMDSSGAAASLPLGFIFLAALAAAVGGVLVWLELLARAIVIYAALLFFPVLLATAIWPRLSHVVHRLAEVLIAVIVSKFVIVVIVVAGAAAIEAAGRPGEGPSLLIGAGLLLLAAWAPWRFYRLLPFMEAGIARHFSGPFQHGWHRTRTRTWQTVRSVPTSGSSGGLKVAGQPVGRPGARTAATAAAGPAGAAATAAKTAGAGARAVGDRLTQGPDGGGHGARWRPEPGQGAPPGWGSVKVAGGHRVFVPTRIRSPRTTGPAGPAGGGRSG